MSRKEDSIIRIEVIIADNRLKDRDDIIVVTWSDGTRSLWFYNKAPKYIRELIHYYQWKGEIRGHEILTLKIKC